MEEILALERPTSEVTPPGTSPEGGKSPAGVNSAAREVAEVRLAAGGDAAAFERLYRNHVARVHSLARRMMGTEAADELTQDVFVRAWQKLGTFRGNAAFSTWLHRLAVNVILVRRRRRTIGRERYGGDETAADSREIRPSDAETRVSFERGLATLPDGAREVLVLHDVEGYKHREIAAMLGVTDGTSKAQLHRARMLMRAHLAD